MKSAVNVDDADVQQMVEESVEHAFEDLAARRWIEAKLKASELISATHKALADCVADLEPEYRARVEDGLRNVENIVRQDDSNCGPNAVTDLQKACAALDEITKPMAELLMDRAMEALLKKRGVL
jgi:molecular chaperone DnaK (HSP70)